MNLIKYLTKGRLEQVKMFTISQLIKRSSMLDANKFFPPSL